MDKVDLDDCFFALNKVLDFFNKPPLEERHRGFWAAFFRTHGKERSLEGLRRYSMEGKFAPKPSDLAAIIATIPRESRDPAHKVVADITPAPEHIRKAWMYWLPIMHDNGLVGGMFKRKEPLPREEALEMLEIINRESKRINQPDAIPLEYKLAHIWDGEGQMMEAVPHD